MMQRNTQLQNSLGESFSVNDFQDPLFGALVFYEKTTKRELTNHWGQDTGLQWVAFVNTAELQYCSLQHYQVRKYKLCMSLPWLVEMSDILTSVHRINQSEYWTWAVARISVSPWMSFSLHWYRRGPTAVLQGLDLVQMKQSLVGPEFLESHKCTCALAALVLKLALQKLQKLHDFC